MVDGGYHLGAVWRVTRSWLRPHTGDSSVWIERIVNEGGEGVDCTFVSNRANTELADIQSRQDSHISRKSAWQSPCVFRALPSTARLRQFFRLNAEKALIIGVTTAILQIWGAFRFGIAAESDFGIFQGSTARFLD